MLKPRPGNVGGHAGAPAIAAILAAYLCLALLYNAATPIFEASDEFRHFLALHAITETRQLPTVAASNDPLTPGVEAGQPPLYYLLAGAISGWVQTGTLPGVDFNPHVQEGIPTPDPDNKNLFVHSAAEAFPYHGLSLAVHLERLLSVLLGAGTVWLTYGLAAELTPGMAAAGPLAAALVAFNPQFLFISTSVDNDNLITLACAAALLVMLRMLRGGLTGRRLWVLSALLGIAMLSKLSGLALPILAGGVAGWLAWGSTSYTVREPSPCPLPPLRERVICVGQPLLILATGPLAIAGWWYVRNWVKYGDPTGLSAWVRLYGGERGGSLLGLLRETPGLFISYWGVFGGFDLRADDWLYFVYLGITVAGIAGLVLWRRMVLKATFSCAPVWLLLAWVALELGALVRWTMITTASTGRLLFPALSAVAALLAVGLLAPIREQARRLASGGLSLALAGLAVFVPIRYLAPAYAAPAIRPSAEALGAPAHQVDITFGDTFALIGYDLLPERAKAGEYAQVALYWRVLKAPEKNYSVSVQLLSGEGTLGQDDSFPGEGRIATRTLRAGDSFKDRYRVSIKPSAPAPIVGRILVALYDESLARLPASVDGRTGAEPVIAQLPVDSAASIATSEQSPLVTFGGELQLIADELPVQALAAGARIDVSLRWRAVQPMQRDYTVFLHLRDASGKLVAQQDQQPRGGAFPTSWWAPGELVEDRMQLSVPAAAPAGRYQLVLGVYDLATLHRQPASTGGDSFTLGAVDIS